MKFKVKSLKILSAIFSAAMIFQAVCPCASAFGGWTLLHDRLENGRNMTVADIKTIVESDPSCVRQVYEDEYGDQQSVLYYAMYSDDDQSYRDKEELAKYLIQKGAPTSGRYIMRGVPLYNCGPASFDLCQWLWDNRRIYNVDFTETSSSSGWTVIHRLIDSYCNGREDYKGNPRCIALIDDILRYHPELANETDNDRHTPFDIAKAFDDIKPIRAQEVLRVIERHGGRPGTARAEVSRRTAGTTKSKTKAEPKAKKYTKEDLLATIGRSGKNDEFRRILQESGIDPNAVIKGRNLLHHTVAKMDFDKTRILLEEFHANPDCGAKKMPYYTPLYNLVHRIERRHNIDDVYKFMDLLLRNGANPNATGYEEMPLLLRFVWSANLADCDPTKTCNCIDLLVTYGADATACDKEGKNAQNYYNNVQVRAKLASYGCPIPVHGVVHRAIKFMLKPVKKVLLG